MNDLSSPSRQEMDTGKQPFHCCWKRYLIQFGLLVVLAILGYSAYMAYRDPDRHETVLLGQSRLASDSPSGLRIVVRDRITKGPIAWAWVTMTLTQNRREIALGKWRTGPDGSPPEVIRLPELAAGEYGLCVETRSRKGRDMVVRRVQVYRPIHLLLSTDKPLYQPGQVMHLRALALNSLTRKPFAGEVVTIEVLDAKGNKVFKTSRAASKFGILSADFELAQELNIGRYRVQALAGGAQVERSVDVRRYVLPKFRVTVATDRPFYRPGDTLKGSVHAAYFFGRTVERGAVEVTAETMDGKPAPIGRVTGTTDTKGDWSFQLRLPDHFVGLPTKPNHAFLELTARVCDSARHSEQANLSLTVSSSELEVTAIPENGVLIPGVENQVYVLTTYPDGRPAACTVKAGTDRVETDSSGVAVLTVEPKDASFKLDIKACDNQGQRGQTTLSIPTDQAIAPLLVRTDKAIYRVGEPVQVTLLGGRSEDTVFLDVVRDRQTVLTRSVQLVKGRTEAKIPLPPDAAGALQIHAYVILPTGEDRGNYRQIMVQAASELEIHPSFDKAVYRPGETAKMKVQVTDSKGAPAPAALGISVVDESLLSLGEVQPSLLKQFLEAEGELLQPKHQVKFFTPSSEFSSEKPNQRLAYALLTPSAITSGSQTLEDLVEKGYLDRRTIERVLGMGSPAVLASLRDDPHWASIAQRISNRSTQFDLVEATGPAKAVKVALERKRYFQTLWQCVGAGCILFFIFFPPIAYIYSCWKAPRKVVDSIVKLTPEEAVFVKLVSQPLYFLKLLTIFPVVFYPAGAAILACVTHWVHHPEAWLWSLFGCEVAVLIGACSWQFRKTHQLEAPGSERVASDLRRTILIYLAQSLAIRAGILIGILMENGWFVSIACLAYIPSSFVTLKYSQEVTERILGTYCLNLPALPRLLEWAVILSIIILLAGLLTPACSRARESARRSSFLNELRQVELAMNQAEIDREDSGKSSVKSAGPAPRVRRYFPETLLWLPELITDDSGRSELEVPLADSITTWRVACDAISPAGRMGGATAPLRVFQDFFVDLDLPVALTLGDEVSVPVACYNYLDAPQTIRLTAHRDSWFEMATNGATQTVHLKPREVRSVLLSIRVTRVGEHRLQVTAQGTKAADAIEREIRVLPCGERIEKVENGIMRGQQTCFFQVPKGSVPGSAALVLKLYPSRFSEIIEGLESVFQAPYGCFEQTSSTTYPNVLALDYLKRTGKLIPEVEAKARKFINAGYQRLLTFEVSGGGFEWFGHPPAHLGLTAYGVLEFTDMAQVHPVDPAVVDRTIAWLLSQQTPAGCWSSREGLHGWQTTDAQVTAYVAWALAEAGCTSPQLDKACAYLQGHSNELKDPYDAALAANAFLTRDRNDVFGRSMVNDLARQTVHKNEGRAFWRSQGRSMTGSCGSDLEVETTALCALALMKENSHPQLVKESLMWLSEQKQGNGTWGATQATVLAMRALIAGTSAPLGSDQPAEIGIAVNGRTVETVRIEPSTSDVVRLVSLTKYLVGGENRVEVRQAPAGEIAYQLAGEYWMSSEGKRSKREPGGMLEIAVRYDRTTLAVDDRLTCQVIVRNRGVDNVPMAIVDLGIPPGFDVETESFARMQEEGRIAKFDVTGNQVILYLRQIATKTPFTFDYRLRARYPLRVEAPASQVYEYYNPSNRNATPRVQLTVQ
jgi:hypothetical protein